MSFKTCTTCRRDWADRDSFLSDADLSLVGYQVNFVELEAGYFLFNHNIAGCGTSLAIHAGQFTDMHEGPVFEERLTGTKTCPGYCERECELKPCGNKCECAYVRDVLQTVKNWPKRKNVA